LTSNNKQEYLMLELLCHVGMKRRT